MPENLFGLFLSAYAFAALGYVGAAIADNWRRED
jgi:hypothetical protein